MKCSRALPWRRIRPFLLANASCTLGRFLTDLLSILLRYNGLTGIQKAVLDQPGSRPPNSDYDLFFGACLAFRSALELLLGPATELFFAGCCRKSTFRHMSQSDQEGSLLCRIGEDDASKHDFFFFNFQSAYEAPIY